MKSLYSCSRYIKFSPYFLTVAAVSLLSAIAMSVTTTANPLTGRILEVLGDYELHHSGPQDSSSGSTSSQPSIPNPRADTAAESQNPPHWPQDHRRIPPHRPIDMHLDYEQRPAGLNGAEYVFIQTMLQGVRLNAVSVLVLTLLCSKVEGKGADAV